MATSRMETPKGLRLHFGLFGKRNAGKSSLINALANQNISIVSSVAGTTTDPVEKAFELSPIGRHRRHRRPRSGASAKKSLRARMDGCCHCGL